MEKVKKGEMQIHRFPLGEIVTEIVEMKLPEERILVVLLLAGERMDEWKEEATEYLRAFARKHDCKAIEAISRFGLEKKLKALGWKKTRILLRNEL